MATTKPSPDPDSPLARLFTAPDHGQDASPNSRLSGPGTSRQARRLQLRNQKFRGATMPTRKSSPNSCSSGRRSSAYSSDAENYSPSGYQADQQGDGRTYGHGVLQELGNAGTYRGVKSSARHRSSSSFDRMTSAIGLGDALSPSNHASTLHVSPTRSRNRMMTQRAYRAVSEETTAYIDHLEAQLAAAQAQAASLDALNTSRDQANRVRALSIEVRNLQDIIDAWENQYEQRIHEAVSAYAESESNLKAQIRTLENNKDESTYRITELEEHLTATTNALQAVEIANVNLEKRLEIMTSLLAASPTRLDFHAESPDRERRSRPVSLVPAYSNATSSQGSPQRRPHSPIFSSSSSILGNTTSPAHQPPSSAAPSLAEKPSFVSTDASSDAASIFSDVAPSIVDSIASVEVPEDKPHVDPWLIPGLWTARAKAGRRMRRFGAGSIGPKPLILPSTNQTAHLSPPFAFAPPVGTIAYRGTDVEATWITGEGIDVSDYSPYRFTPTSTTNEFEAESPALTNTTENLEKLYHDESSAESCPDSRVDNHARTCSQNLLQELAELDSSDSNSDKTFSNKSEGSNSSRSGQRGRVISKPHRATPTNRVSPTRDDLSTILRRDLSVACAGEVSMTKHLIPLSTTYTFVFTDLWNSPLLVIRNLIHSIQSRWYVPKPILDGQWAVVGVLLGPLAQRRLLCQPPPSRSEAGQWRLLDSYKTTGMPDTDRKQGQYGNHAQECCCTTPVATRKLPLQNLTTEDARSRTSAVQEHTWLEEQASPHLTTYGPWLWLKFSFTLALAVGIAFKDGPGSLMVVTDCVCNSRTPRPTPPSPARSLAPSSAATSRSWTRRLRRRRTFSPVVDSESD